MWEENVTSEAGLTIESISYLIVIDHEVAILYTTSKDVT
jgi:hypothetical protein